MEWISLIAILIGPLLAVLATRWLDQRREIHARRMEIFKTLMRTRRSPTVPEHVGALNLIEIEFANDALVVPAWKKLFEHLGTEQQRRVDEVIERQTDPRELNERNARFNQRLFDERQLLLAKLLHAMAKRLRFRIEQLEIFEGGYLPQGWVDSEQDSMEIRKFVKAIAGGQAILPVGVLNITSPAVTRPETPKTED